MNLEVCNSSCEESKEKYAELVNNKFNSLKLIVSLVRHDLKNMMSELAYYQGLNKYELPVEYNEIFERTSLKMRDTIDLLSSSDDIEFEFIRILIPILYSTGMIEHVECEVENLKLKTDVRFFISIVTNILSNTKEAYERKYDTLDELNVKIKYEDGMIHFEDNAGGFDISKIEYGKSDKKDDGNSEHVHGFFLKTMIDRCHLFNMRFGIQAIHGGTRISIGINTNKETIDDKCNDKSII
jgi:hypothetical protein